MTECDLVVLHDACSRAGLDEAARCLGRAIKADQSRFSRHMIGVYEHLAWEALYRDFPGFADDQIIAGLTTPACGETTNG